MDDTYYVLYSNLEELGYMEAPIKGLGVDMESFALDVNNSGVYRNKSGTHFKHAKSAATALRTSSLWRTM